MSTHTTDSTTARALRPPRAGRSNGQWAVDGRAALTGRVVLTRPGRLLADAVVRRLTPA